VNFIHWAPQDKVGGLVSFKRGLCVVLTLLRMHRREYERCSALQECLGHNMRKRLEELREQSTMLKEETKRPANPAA
jgi:hypothetical protein